MAAQVMQKPATEKQVAYIKRLSVEVGRSAPELGDSINSFEASTLISELIGKSPEKVINGGRRKHVVNEPRLGLAMKECYRNCKRWGWDVLNDRRDVFIKEVIDTYELFEEVEEKLRKRLPDRESE